MDLQENFKKLTQIWLQQLPSFRYQKLLPTAMVVRVQVLYGCETWSHSL